MKSQLLILCLLGLSLGTTGGWAGAANISGTWACTIDRPEGNGGPINVTFVFKQQGEKLTGTYSGLGPRGPRDEEKVTGTVKGDKAVFGYELKLPDNIKKPGKPSLTVTFTGAIESSTKMTGTVGSPYCAEGCKWTATKKKK